MAIDAFSGDVIPAHLLTLEAVKLYFKHLKPDGILAFHISSTYLNLMPVMGGISESIKIPLCYVEEPESELNPVSSVWVLFTNNQTFLSKPQIQKHFQNYNASPDTKVFWTDDYSSVLPLFH